MTFVEPRINYQSLASQGRLKRLAKRLYNTVALKRAQARRIMAQTDSLVILMNRSQTKVCHSVRRTIVWAEAGLLDLDKPETAVTSDAIRPDGAGRSEEHTSELQSRLH